VLPELQVAEHLRNGTLVDLMPGSSLAVALYWHCWNLESAVLDALTRALKAAAALALAPVPPS
jgi:LysR family transcriptional regulator (chromosome initiation inhibitor)